MNSGIKYRLTIWFDDTECPDRQVTTCDVKLINNYLDKNWMHIHKHEIKSVDEDETSWVLLGTIEE